MSYTAIWRNRNRPNKCSGPTNVCGGSSGYDIPPGMVRYGTFRVGRITPRRPDPRRGIYHDCYHLEPPEYGRVMTQEEADELDIWTGRSVPYSRNCVRLVMTRAMRRRGYKSDDYYYNRKAERIAKLLIEYKTTTTPHDIRFCEIRGWTPDETTWAKR